MGYVIFLWHSLSLPYNYSVINKSRLRNDKHFVFAIHLNLQLILRRIHIHTYIHTYMFLKVVCLETFIRTEKVIDASACLWRNLLSNG